MRKTVMVLAVLAMVVAVANPVTACDGKANTKASNEGGSCANSSAKAVYAKTLEDTGCKKTAQAAYKNALAENVYAKSYAESSCSKTASKAAYDAVLADTGCSKSAEAAATHAVAKASYDATLAETSCSKSAQAAYDEVTKTASCAFSASETNTASTQAKSACQGTSATDKVAQADKDVQVASNEGPSSR